MPGRTQSKKRGGSNGHRRRGRRRSRAIRTGLQVAALGGVAYLFVHERQLFAGFGRVIGRADWVWIAAGLLAEIASIPALAATQLIVLRTGGVEARPVEMSLLTLAGNALSLSLPAGGLVAEGYWFAQYRRLGAKEATAVWSELSAGAIAFTGLAGVALLGALLAGRRSWPTVTPVLMVVVAGSAGATALFRRPRLLVASVDWIERHIGRRMGDLIRSATRTARGAAGAIREAHPGLGAWTIAFLFSFLNWMLDALCLALSFRVVGNSIPAWDAVLLAFAGAKLLSAIGITPGGLGVVEGGLVATFIAFGVPGGTAAAGVLVYRGITLIGLAGIGWLAAALVAVRSRDS